MADRPKRTDLIADPTPRERALAAVDARFEDMSTAAVRQAKSPVDAAPAYLPYLAWERSVDVYDPAWPDAIKRAVVEAAPVVQRYKGTVHAVEAALAALSIRAEVVEWWQDTPRGAPYTFRVTAYAQSRVYDGPLLDARLIRVAFAAVNRAKPLSRAFALTVAASLPGSLGLAPIGAAVTRASAALRARNDEAFAATLGVTGFSAALSRVHVLMIASPDP